MQNAATYGQLDLIETPVFVLELNDQNLPVYAAFNARALRTSGRPLSDYLGHTALEVYPEAYGRMAFARHCEVRDTGVSTSYQLDLPIAGVARSIRTTLHPQFDATGHITHLYGTSIDLTLERRALDAQVQFETVTKEMEQFVAMAAHDLRTPMRNVASIAALLADDFIDMGDGKVELIESLEKISTKSINLLAEVLDHVEIVSIKDRTTAFSFPALCHDIWDTLDPNGCHRLVTSTNILRADRTVMQISLRNLIDNALKHGQRDHLKIDVTTQPGMPGMIDVMITDNGAGFSKDDLKLMNGTRFRSESGYGLFAVKRLISARGGQFVARNNPDKEGAVIRFSLPGTCLNDSGSFGGLPDLNTHPRNRSGQDGKRKRA